MTHRKRIRTIKPEIWQSLGELSHGARLLYIGLITRADDEGRMKYLPRQINASIFYEDEVPTRRFNRWVNELINEQLICIYCVKDRRYLAILRWNKHQRINRPNPSEYPCPSENMEKEQEEIHGKESAKTGEKAPSRVYTSIKDLGSSKEKRNKKEIQTKQVKESEDNLPLQPEGLGTETLVADLPAELEGTVDDVLQILDRAYQAKQERGQAKGARKPTRLAVSRVIAIHPTADHLTAAQELESWLLDGKGSKKRSLAIVDAYRNWLKPKSWQSTESKTTTATGGPSWQRGMLSHGRMTAEQEQHLYERDREKLEEVAATATEEEIRSLLDPAAPQNVVSLHPVEGCKEEVGR